MKKIAHLFSVLLHPLLMPTIGVLIVLKSGTYLSYIPLNLQRVLIWLVAISTLVVPLFMVPFYFFQKTIKTIRMETIKERIVPFFTTSIVFMLCFFYLKYLNAPSSIQLFLLAIAFVAFSASIITFFWKISVHMAGIGGLTSFLLVFAIKYNANLTTIILILVLLSGLLGTCRLVLNAHKPSQIYAGYFLGLALVPISFLLFS